MNIEIFGMTVLSVKGRFNYFNRYIYLDLYCFRVPRSVRDVLIALFLVASLIFNLRADARITLIWFDSKNIGCDSILFCYFYLTTSEFVAYIMKISERKNIAMPC